MPVVGPVVAQSLALYESERRNSHVDAFLAALAAQLEGIREAKLDKEFVIGLEAGGDTPRAIVTSIVGPD